jgi:hypothetical protein
MNKRWLVWFVLAVLAVGITAACMLFTPGRGPIKFFPAVLPDAQVGVPYAAQVSISDNATPAINIDISEGSLPPGLTMEKVENQDVARIFGTPQQTGTFKFKVFVYCYGTNVSGQQGEQEYSLVVK